MSKCLGRDISVRQHSKLPATSRHHCDMTEILLKATLNPNQTKLSRLIQLIFISCKLSPVANCLQFAWNIKSCFLGKIRKNFKMLSAESFTQSAKH